MRVLFVSAEVAPLAKVGGLADVVGSLPKALKKLDVDARIIMPAYETIDQEKYAIKLVKKNIKVSFGQVQESVDLLETKLPDSHVKVYLLSNQRYLSKDGVYAQGGTFAEIQRFLFFSQAVLAIIPALDWQPEIIHCQDWHTGLIPLLLNLYQKNKHLLGIKTLFTIHNLAMQGRWNWSAVMKFLGLTGNEHPNLQVKFNGPYGQDIDLIEQGILGADLINTVSKSYAQEILTKQYYQRGLGKTLRQRAKDIVGIVNGIDIESWNPQTDTNICQQYSVKNVRQKKKNKLFLQKKLALLPKQKIPLIGLISRLAEQKGIDLIVSIVGEIVKAGAQLVILGTGNRQLEKKLAEISKQYPGQVSVTLCFDAKLAHQIYAGSDFFLMPSRFEPCGLGQLIAMRYGTVPIVRATGGLRDTIKNVIFKNNKIKGTGFVFHL
ncbi:MAG: glycogen synthase, partial [Candidatus Aenigmarchaeota archaeon]|nr:glycogen synthase [Candidatus Aenigmarchaeota archaeon]